MICATFIFVAEINAGMEKMRQFNFLYWMRRATAISGSRKYV